MNMMIATTCFLVTLIILNHGQSGNSHVVTVRQATDSFKIDSKSFSVDEMNDRLEFDEGSGIMETMLNVPECLGTGSAYSMFYLPNPSGCYIFQTTGFNMNGYANYTGRFSANLCSYTILFGGNVNGTVTVKEKDFQFQEPDGNGECVDYVFISGVNDEQQEYDNSDSDDRNSHPSVVQYCGTITEDKTRDFSTNKLRIQLAADKEENGNGAEIAICID